MRGPDFEVVLGRSGWGLVRDGARVFRVPWALAQALAHAGDDGRRQWRALVGEIADRRPASPIWLRLVLLPAGAADRLARNLSPLAGTAGLLGLAAIGVAGLAVAAGLGARDATLSRAGAAGGVAVFVLTAIWHELGHAAALRHEGLRAGRIGFGLLWVLPVLTCDVTAAALLTRGGRLRVDAGGMVFQFAAAGLLAAVAHRWPPAGPGAAAALAAVIWNAIPWLRTDGHWLVLDLLGLPAQDAPPPPGWPRPYLAALVLWRLTTAMSLLVLLLWVPWRVDALLARLGAAAWPAAAANLSRLAAWIVIGVGGWRALRQVRALLKAVARDLALTPPAR